MLAVIELAFNGAARSRANFDALDIQSGHELRQNRRECAVAASDIRKSRSRRNHARDMLRENRDSPAVHDAAVKFADQLRGAAGAHRFRS